MLGVSRVKATLHAYFFVQGWSSICMSSLSMYCLIHSMSSLPLFLQADAAGGKVVYPVSLKVHEDACLNSLDLEKLNKKKPNDNYILENILFFLSTFLALETCNTEGESHFHCQKEK